jgi:hypothetical protein
MPSFLRKTTDKLTFLTGELIEKSIHFLNKMGSPCGLPVPVVVPGCNPVRGVSRA